MTENPKLKSDTIIPTESCNDDDLGFFEQPTEEFNLCKLENKVREFQDFIRENPDTPVIELLKKSPILESSQLSGTKYDPLQYFPYPPVIGVMGTKWSQEEKRNLTFKEGYGDEYKDNIFTTNPEVSSSNGVFITYEGKRGFLTTFHSGYLFIKSLEGERYPNHIFDQIRDSMFIEFDENLSSNISKTLKSRLETMTSPVFVEEQETPIFSDILGVLSYDEGGSFSQEHPSMKFRAGVPLQISQETEDQIIEQFLQEYEADRTKYKDQYTGEKLRKLLESIDRGITLVKSSKGEYVGKYAYRTSRNSYIYGGGISGGPVLQRGRLVGIHKGAIKIAGIYISIFEPIDQIKEKLLSEVQ